MYFISWKENIKLGVKKKLIVLKYNVMMMEKSELKIGSAF